MGYKKVLLCYDGSREGRKALRVGADLAHALGSETHLLAVVDMRAAIAQSAGLVVDVAFSQLEQAARDILDEGVRCMASRGQAATGHLAVGNPLDEIVRMAQSMDADLVVVGHRCRHGLARWWMGSGNTPLMDRLSCSILVACSSAAEQSMPEPADEAPAAEPQRAQAAAPVATTPVPEDIPIE
jgi:nucleotide-binding universal stress UspA family protein